MKLICWPCRRRTATCGEKIDTPAAELGRRYPVRL